MLAGQNVFDVEAEKRVVVLMNGAILAPAARASADEVARRSADHLKPLNRGARSGLLPEGWQSNLRRKCKPRTRCALRAQSSPRWLSRPTRQPVIASSCRRGGTTTHSQLPDSTSGSADRADGQVT